MSAQRNSVGWVIQPGEAPTFESPMPDVRQVSFLVDNALCGARNLTAGLFAVPPHGHSVPDIHVEQEEIYYFVSGHGRAILGGREHSVHAGTVVYIPSAVPHQLINDGDDYLRLFFVFAPQPDRPYRHEAESWQRVGV